MAAKEMGEEGEGKREEGEEEEAAFLYLLLSSTQWGLMRPNWCIGVKTRLIQGPTTPYALSHIQEHSTHPGKHISPLTTFAIESSQSGAEALLR